MIDEKIHFRAIQERAKLAGGKLTFCSQPDSGTEIEVTIPAPLAYVRDSPAAQTAAPIRATAMVRQNQSLLRKERARWKGKKEMQQTHRS